MISNCLISKYLNLALETLFRSVEKQGFWNSQDKKIVGAIRYRIGRNDELIWDFNASNSWRYEPFALMGVLHWRNSRIASNAYDQNIKFELDYFTKKIHDKGILSQISSYEIGPLIVSFSYAYKIFQDEKYKNIAWYLYNYSKEKFDFNDSEDGLLLYGWSFLNKFHEDINLKNVINKALEDIIQKQNEKGLFIFENLSTERHQNQMYVLLGIGKAIEVLGRKEYLKNIEKTLDYTINNRMLDNGAFIWNDPYPIIKFWKKIVGKIVGIVPHWELLFECHQTFFINAALQYYKSGGKKDYNKNLSQAVDWIYGKNILRKSLVELSGIGVPIRVMTINGNINVNMQKFKGTYEIGSYIMTLTGLIELLSFKNIYE